MREIANKPANKPFVPQFIEKQASSKAPDNFDLWAHIQRGSMPELLDENIDWYRYYASYVRSYLERDVRDLIKVRDEEKFYKFMVACAARTGQLLNASDIATVVDVNVNTIQGWISVLQASGIIHLLRPFWTNTNKRLSKTPKLYFLDTGLACYLSAWNTPQTLRRGAMAGHTFETFVVSEVLKSYMNAGCDLRNVSFYRDARKREVDLIIQDGHTLHPVEIKSAATVRFDAVKNFNALESMANFEVGWGAVICQADAPYLINPQVQAVSVWDI